MLPNNRRWCVSRETLICCAANYGVHILNINIADNHVYLIVRSQSRDCDQYLINCAVLFCTGYFNSVSVHSCCSLISNKCPNIEDTLFLFFFEVYPSFNFPKLIPFTMKIKSVKGSFPLINPLGPPGGTCGIPGQMGYVIPLVCSGSPLGSPPR